jgi:hypothetical protein
MLVAIRAKLRPVRSGERINARSAFRGRAAEAFARHAQRVYGTMTPPLSTEL